jgi:hypothetical protein
MASDITDEQIIAAAYQHLSVWDQDHIRFARAVLALASHTGEAEPVRVGRIEVHAGKVKSFAFEQTDIADGGYALLVAAPGAAIAAREVDEATAMKGGRWVSADDIEHMTGELLSLVTGDPYTPTKMVDAFQTLRAALASREEAPATPSAATSASIRRGRAPTRRPPKKPAPPLCARGSSRRTRRPAGDSSSPKRASNHKGACFEHLPLCLRSQVP